MIKIEIQDQSVLAVLNALAQCPDRSRAPRKWIDEFPDASLAELYDPLTMPPALVRAHHQLDAAVDAAYGKRNFRNDAERVAFLFELYQKYTSLLPVSAKPGAKRRTGKKRTA